MKRCLVTGGTGFIGANLVQKLVQEGHRVDLFIRPGSSLWRLRHLLKDIVLHEMAAGDSSDIQQHLSRIRPDWIFNLAAHGAYSWQNDSSRIIETNLTYPIHLLETAASLGFEAFIQAGSSSEYGLQDAPPSEEETPRPNSVYAIAKNAASHYCHWIGVQKNLPVCVLRLYSIYGPFEDPRRLIPQLALKGLEGTFPPLVNPRIARDFVYVTDAVEAFLRAARHAGHLKGELFNVGTGVQTTLEEAVETSRLHFDIRETPSWESMPNRAWDTTSWMANPEKIKAKLEWNPSVSFSEGFALTSKWFESHAKSKPWEGGPAC